jgi:putative peptidoglycan lipid II flippase
MAILKNSMIVAVWTMFSRFLGFLRDLVIANKLGAGLQSDAFFIAMQLPNLFRRLLGEGALNIAFVPIYARVQAEGEAAAAMFANVVFRWLFLILLALTVAGVVFMPALVSVSVPGWVNQPEKFDLTVLLGRITFPYVTLICLSAFMGALCNVKGKFAAYASVPALLNLAFLGMLLGIHPLGMDAAHAAAWAMPVGGVAQLLYMWWEMHKLGLRVSLGKPGHHPEVKTMLWRFAPAAVGVGVLQLSLLIDNIVASFTGQEAAVSYLTYANRFYQLPMALIGVAVATVLLPHLSVLLGKGDRKEASKSFMGAVQGCLALAGGATVWLFLLAPEMIGSLLHHGEFSSWASEATAWAMMGYVAGLPAYVLTKITAPAFFASEDPRTPVKASSLALLVNFISNFVLAFGLIALGHRDVAHVGIAVSTALGGYTNAFLQWRWLRRKGVLELKLSELKAPLLKLLPACAAMAVVLVAGKLLVPFNVEWSIPLRLVWLATVGGLGALSFAAVVQWNGLMDMRQLLRDMRRRKPSAASVTFGSADS